MVPTPIKKLNHEAIMKFMSFKPADREGAILGDATLYFPSIKMTMQCSIIKNKTNGSLFVAFPNRKYEVHGETKYYSLVKFDKDINETVQKEIVRMYELWTEENKHKANQSELPF